MQAEAEKIRKLIDKRIPPGSITPEHTPDSHHYRVSIFPGNPLLDSVTTKTKILNKGHLKDWGIRLAIDHIRINIDRITDPEQREIILYDASQQSAEVLDDAGDVGNRAHAIIQSYIENWIQLGIRAASILPFIPNGETDVRVLSAVRAAEKFMNEHHIYPIRAEMLVASERLGTAGTMDFLCFIGKVTAVGNIPGCAHDFWQRGTNPMHQGCVICGEKVDYELSIVDWKTSNSIAGKADYALQTAAYKDCLNSLTGLNPKNLWVIRLDKKSGNYEKGVVVDPARAVKAYRIVADLYAYMEDGVDKLPIIGKEKKILQI